MDRKFCPKCKSEDVEIEIGPLGTPPVFNCNKCGYSGIIFPEKEKLNQPKK